MVCYRDKERTCNDKCAAYCKIQRHSTNCLELATQIEVSNRMRGVQLSNDLNTFYSKVLAIAMNSFRETLQSAMRI